MSALEEKQIEYRAQLTGGYQSRRIARNQLRRHRKMGCFACGDTVTAKTGQTKKRIENGHTNWGIYHADCSPRRDDKEVPA